MIFLHLIRFLYAHSYRLLPQDSVSPSCKQSFLFASLKISRVSIWTALFFYRLNLQFKNLVFLLNSFLGKLNLVCQRLVTFCVPECNCSFTIFAPEHPPHLLQTIVLVTSQFFVLTECIYVRKSLLIQRLGYHSLNRQTESLLTLGERRPSVEDVAQAWLVVALVVLLDYFLDRGIYFHSFTLHFLVGDLGLYTELIGCILVRFFIKFYRLDGVSDWKLGPYDLGLSFSYPWLSNPVLEGCFNLVKYRLLQMLDMAF